jgi:hypothetical protein
MVLQVITSRSKADVIAIAGVIATLIGSIAAILALRQPDHAPERAIRSGTVAHYDDPVKDACMNGSIVDCQNYAGRIRVKCNPYDTACKLLATCWDGKVRALTVVEQACKLNTESCEFQKKNMRASVVMNCDKKTLGNY